MATVKDFCKIQDQIIQQEYEARRDIWHNQEEIDADYMSNMDHWLCVHVTKFMPKRNKNGKLFMPTTAMATGNKLPRATVHVTLNRVVSSHIAGSWDSMPIVVLAPYRGVVAENGNPSEIATEDTYFIPNPDTGLVLPPETCIVKPDNSCLFRIGDHVATYKTDDFTTEEIATILSYVSPFEREEYEMFERSNVPEYDIKQLLGYDKELIEIYNNSNKQEFLHGLLDEDRWVILTHFLRDAVVRMMMEKMGYKFVMSHEDSISGRVADVARSAGISGNSGNKGHSGSLEKELEEAGVFVSGLMDTFATANVNDIYDMLVMGRGTMDELTYSYIQKPIIQGIMSDTVPDFYDCYKVCFTNYMDCQISVKQYETEFNAQYDDLVGRNTELQKDIESLNKLKQGGIAAYDPHLDVAFRRHVARMTKMYIHAIDNLKKKSKYTELQQHLNDFAAGKPKQKAFPFLSPEIALAGINNAKEYE